VWGLGQFNWLVQIHVGRFKAVHGNVLQLATVWYAMGCHDQALCNRIPELRYELSAPVRGEVRWGNSHHNEHPSHLGGCR